MQIKANWKVQPAKHTVFKLLKTLFFVHVYEHFFILQNQAKPASGCFTNTDEKVSCLELFPDILDNMEIYVSLCVNYIDVIVSC